MNIYQHINIARPLTASCILLLAAACAPKIDNKGYVADTPWKEKIVEGKTTKNDVLNEFGSPSSQSSFGEETWYYISSRKEGYGFLRPEVVEQHVLRIAFDASGTVSSVADYDKDRAKEFALVQRSTPTEGHTLGFFEQLFGNLGRFNRPASASDTAAPGRRPSP